MNAHRRRNDCRRRLQHFLPLPPASLGLLGGEGGLGRRRRILLRKLLLGGRLEGAGLEDG